MQPLALFVEEQFWEEGTNHKINDYDNIDKKRNQGFRRKARIRKFNELKQIIIESKLEKEIQKESAYHKDKKVMEMFKKDRTQFKTIDGVIFYKDRIFVPTKELRERVMRDNHDNPMAGHPGIGRTLGLVKRTFYWPSMENDITTYVKGCESCQKNKIIHQKRRTE